MICTWAWSVGSLREEVRASRRTSKSRSTSSTPTGTHSRYEPLGELLLPSRMQGRVSLKGRTNRFSPTPSGLHQLGQRRAQRQRVSLFRALPQQQPPLERDGQTAHSHRPFQGVPPALRVPTLFQWVQSYKVTEYRRWNVTKKPLLLAKDKGEKKLFGFAFTPLMREDGTTLSDEVHELYVYKVREGFTCRGWGCVLR